MLPAKIGHLTAAIYLAHAAHNDVHFNPVLVRNSYRRCQTYERCPPWVSAVQKSVATRDDGRINVILGYICLEQCAPTIFARLTLLIRK
jgi:hypothetical protein